MNWDCVRAEEKMDESGDKIAQDAVLWYVMRAYKSEGLAERLLTEEGVEYFIPKWYVVRVYHGRKSRRLVPVIPSLLFVRTRRSTLVEFKKRYNFLQFVIQSIEGIQTYLTVPDKQMEDFIRVSERREQEICYYTPAELNLERGSRVRIIGGPFDGVEGVFLKIRGARNRRLVVEIPNTLLAAVEIEPDLVEPID